jgi:chromosome segregation ATPase
MSYEAFIQDVFGDTRRLLDYERERSNSILANYTKAKEDISSLKYDNSVLEIAYDRAKKDWELLEIVNKRLQKELSDLQEEQKRRTSNYILLQNRLTNALGLEQQAKDKWNRLNDGIEALGYTRDNNR